MNGTFALRRNSGAAYRQIAQLLRHRIASGEFAGDRRLPTEDELILEFGVSRHTVRAALGVLVSEGLVERFPGRGTFLTERSEAADGWRIRSLDDIINESFSADPELRGSKWVSASTDREAARALDLEPRHPMLLITAVRRDAEGPLACSQIFLPESVGHGVLDVLEENIGRQPIVRLIETRLGLRAAHAVQVAMMRIPQPSIAEALREPADRMTLALLRTYTTDQGMPFEFSRLFGKPGRFSNTIEFARQDSD